MKNMLFQAATFLGLAGFIFLVLSYSAHRKVDYVLPLPFSKIDEVRVETPAGSFTVRVRVVDGERVYDLEDSGGVSPADQRAAFGFLAQLTRIAIVEKFPMSEFNSQADKEALGLGKAGKVVVTLQTGRVYTLELGNDTASGTEIYARSSAAPDTIYTINNVYLSKVLPSWMDLKYHLALSLAGVEKISVAVEGLEPIVVAQQNGKWTGVSGISSDKVALLMAALKALKYENYFVVDTDDMLYEFGLATPDELITLYKNSDAQEFPLSVYHNRYYMLTQEHQSKNILVLNPSTGEALVRALVAAR